METNTNNPEVSNWTVSFGLAVAVASLVNAILVLMKEKNKAVQAAMARMTGHHWITHALIVILTFVILGFALARCKVSTNRLIAITIGGVVASGLIIVGFYLTDL